MHLLAAELNPLGHVMDRNIIGGPDALLMGDPHGTPIVTMHMLTLLLATGLLLWIMNLAAKAITTGPSSEGNDRYLTRGRMAQLIEVITLYLRDTVVKPVLGEKTNKYLPYLLTLFFFVLMNNLLGLVPLLDLQHIVGAFLGDSHFAVIGGTATGNLAVTGGLALIAFLVIQVHGLRELGLAGWAHHLLGGAPWYLAPIMVPVELLGMFIKPAALAIRLFANMMAGHTLMATLALFGLMALSGMESWIAGLGISVIAGAFAVAITFLELFVAFLQAFIFMFLTAVFIGQLSPHDHEHEHAAETAHA
ncbi:MAG: F0F1 ATP synthase subunit A [Phycisphaerae bacterium]|nr:F0F1 ATP synthase subunit A [Phycisphaerae bacterium]NNF41701.1 F0F1 ATP synthase subunit A [Phycisphaerales bacterium]